MAEEEEEEEASDGHTGEEDVTVDEILHEEQSHWQHILVFRSKSFGLCLALDGVLQSTEQDEHLYHEHLVHVPLLSHPAPARVLICGGGNGAAAREALRHPSVQHVVVIDIDPAVSSACRRHLPRQAGELSSPRVELRHCDAAEAVACSSLGTFDAIIVDGTNMGVTSGRSSRLWATDFFSSCHARLVAGGVLSTQLGACRAEGGFGLTWSSDAPRGMEHLRRAGFEEVAPYSAEVPSYGGLALFALAKKAGGGAQEPLAAAASCSAAASRGLQLEFCGSSALFRSLFCLPAPLAAALALLEDSEDEEEDAKRLAKRARVEDAELGAGKRETDG